MEEAGQFSIYLSPSPIIESVVTDEAFGDSCCVCASSYVSAHMSVFVIISIYSLCVCALIYSEYV